MASHDRNHGCITVILRGIWLLLAWRRFQAQSTWRYALQLLEPLFLLLVTIAMPASLSLPSLAAFCLGCKLIPCMAWNLVSCIEQYLWSIPGPRSLTFQTGLQRPVPALVRLRRAWSKWPELQRDKVMRFCMFMAYLPMTWLLLVSSVVIIINIGDASDEIREAHMILVGRTLDLCMTVYLLATCLGFTPAERDHDVEQVEAYQRHRPLASPHARLVRLVLCWLLSLASWLCVLLIFHSLRTPLWVQWIYALLASVCSMLLRYHIRDYLAWMCDV
jgi:hypothetical protein